VVAQVDPLERDVRDLRLDGRLDVGQKAATKGPGELAEVKVERRGLDRRARDPELARADPLAVDRLAQLL
jgi:hypothetical protein